MKTEPVSGIYLVHEVAAKLGRRPRTLCRPATRARLQALYGMPEPRLGKPLGWPKEVFDHWFTTGKSLVGAAPEDQDKRDRAGLEDAYGTGR